MIGERLNSQEKHKNEELQEFRETEVIAESLPIESGSMLLDSFAPSDLDDFLRKLCRLWHIDLDLEEELL